MLSPEELSFVEYWERERIAQSSFYYKIFRGLTMAFLFVMPIALMVLSVWFFFPDWYMKISKTSSGMFVTTLFALFIIALFFSFFRMHYNWEKNEQAYLELKYKLSKNK